jgi:hypothetical protein
MNDYNKVELEFLQRANVRGKLLLFCVDNALAFIQRCWELNCQILGVDAFEIVRNSTRPIMAASIELTGSVNERCERARAHVHAHSSEDLLFEIVCVCDEPPYP